MVNRPAPEAPRRPLATFSEKDAEDPSSIVDVERELGAEGAWSNIGLGKRAVLPHKAEAPPAIVIEAHDLAAVVDAEKLSSRGARHIDSGEDTIVEQESVGQVRGYRVGLLTVCPDDLSLGVHAGDQGGPGAGEIDHAEGDFVLQKAMQSSLAIDVAAHGPAAVIDAEGHGVQAGAWGIDGGEGTVL